MKQTSLFNRGISVLFWGHWLRVLVISAQKLDKRKLTAENTRCWQPSHCYLLSSHRHLQLPVDMVNIQGSSLCWWRWCSLAGSGWRGALMLDSYRGEGWGYRKETDLKERAMSVFSGPWEQLHHLDSVDLYEAGFETQVWAHVVWFWSSVCVSSGDVSLLHSSSQLETF